MVTRTCNQCGTQADAADEGLPEGWSFTVENDRVDYQCSPCIRRNIRAIEGKLPTEWWE
ncbi:MAG TPA: hypothetical protein VMY34_04745 [Acidimicrobiales bacterium]|nr:hypothetical protein [Acidimicrobiales bacterium]